MAEQKENRRDQVKALIAEGKYTKAEIAKKLEVNASSVSSQMTYLRWMGNFIVSDENKILSFCDEETYNAKAAAAEANRKLKSTTSTKTPQEQANALAKTLKRQNADLAKAEAKVAQIDKDLIDQPDDEELIELEAEAKATLTLLKIKIKRNTAKAAELPEAEEVVEEEEIVSEEETDESEDLL